MRKRILVSLAIALSVAVIMTVFAAVLPPFSLLYDWLEGNRLGYVWTGLSSGVIAVCVTLYLRASK